VQRGLRGEEHLGLEGNSNQIPNPVAKKNHSEAACPLRMTGDGER